MSSLRPTTSRCGLKAQMKSLERCQKTEATSLSRVQTSWTSKIAWMPTTKTFKRKITVLRSKPNTIFLAYRRQSRTAKKRARNPKFSTLAKPRWISSSRKPVQFWSSRLTMNKVTLRTTNTKRMKASRYILRSATSSLKISLQGQQLATARAHRKSHTTWRWRSRWIAMLRRTLKSCRYRTWCLASRTFKLMNLKSQYLLSVKDRNKALRTWLYSDRSKEV